MIFTALNGALLFLPYLKEPTEDAADATWGREQRFSCAGLAFNILSVLAFAYASIKSPGYLQRLDVTEKPTWSDLVYQVNFNLLCPECEIIRPPRSRHCYLCGSCISRFDHHCEWLNSCVGGQNNVGFFVFLWIFLGNIIVTILLIIFFIYAATIC